MVVRNKKMSFFIARRLLTHQTEVVSLYLHSCPPPKQCTDVKAAVEKAAKSVINGETQSAIELSLQLITYKDH